MIRSTLLTRGALVGAALLFLTPPARAVTATGMSSFEGEEEPTRRYIVSSDSFVSDSYDNMTDQGANTVRMLLRFRNNNWWDGDRGTSNEDRQRAEVKGLGPHQKVNQTFEYSSNWRMNSGFNGTGRFCHIYQLKPTDGDEGSSGAPLVVVSLGSGSSSANVRYWSGQHSTFQVVRSITHTPGTYQSLVIRIRPTNNNTANGEVRASRNGDALSGVTNVAVYRPNSTDYRPKWGLYRSVRNGDSIGDDYVEHQNVTVNPVSSSSVAAPTFSPGGGTYTSAQTVTIATTTSGASIRYTTNGSTPSSTSGTVYSGPVTISSTTTLRAIAYTSSASSSVSSAAYTIDTGGGGGETSWEAESLSRTSSGASTALQSDSNTSGGTWVALQADGVGDYVQYTLPNVTAGTYSLRMSSKIHPNRGILQLSVNGANLGGTFDQYSASPAYPETTFGTVTFSTSGNQTVRLTVVGRNSSAGAFTLSADTFTLVSTSTPPPTVSLEAESLSPTASGATLSTSNDSNASGGVVQWLNSDGVGDYIQFTTPSLAAGTYQVRFRYKPNTSRGQHNLTIDGATVGGTIDQYATSQTYTEVTVGNVTFSSAGAHTIRLTVTGQNSSSSNYILSADRFTFVGQ